MTLFNEALTQFRPARKAHCCLQINYLLYTGIQLGNYRDRNRHLRQQSQERALCLKQPTCLKLAGQERKPCVSFLIHLNLPQPQPSLFLFQIYLLWSFSTSLNAFWVGVPPIQWQFWDIVTNMAISIHVVLTLCSVSSMQIRFSYSDISSETLLREYGMSSVCIFKPYHVAVSKGPPATVGNLFND